MSPLPVRALEKATFVPSGDHVGSRSACDAVVSRVTPEPLAFIT